MTNYFDLVFVTNYIISSQLLMDIIFRYPLTGQSDTTRQALKTYLLTYAWYFTFIQQFLQVVMTTNSHESLEGRMLHCHPNLVL